MPSLTRTEAETRADLLRVTGYEIDLDLGGDAEEFDSVTAIRFRCAQPGAETFVEIKPVRLIDVELNGRAIDPAGLIDNRLRLADLAADNHLVVRARMASSRTGEGLHRFVDPEDGEVYLYVQAFLDDAQRVFACFDQPDLKAPVTLSVTTRPGWEVAANGAGVEVTPGRWEFARTEPLATYLVSLIAGPYHVHRDSHAGVPLAIYCRRSMASHLDQDIDEILDVTKACLDRYHELFRVRYPFGKYDQAFVPEFNAGAMENAGLATIRDELVFRSAVADSERELRAVTIAHEMAHMWFGDLVTMRWWEDLWLSESFAEYMGYRVTAEVTRFSTAWTGFAVGRKGWGYAADQRPSTHPVAPGAVGDTTQALLNFDGISYAKGASVLRQLVAWLGDDAFLAGLRAHVTRHAFGNATLTDLLGALGAAAGRDLSEWAQLWLRRAQVNTLHAQVSVGADSRYETVHIVQTAPSEYPTLRPHRINVGIYRGGERLRSVAVELSPPADGGRTPVPELTGISAGDLLLVNDEDLTYAKVRLDPASRAALPQTLAHLTDPLARALVWSAVTDAVRDADMPVAEFVTLLESALPTESAVSVLKDLTRFATSRAVDALASYAGVLGRFVTPDRVAEVEARVARACRTAMARAVPGGGAQLVAARGYIGATDHAGELQEWLEGGAPAGLVMDAELRWAVIARLVVLGAAGPAEIAAEAERDRSAQGAAHAARCNAAVPTVGAKERAWRIMMTDLSLSNRLVTAAADGFWHPGQEALTSSYVERFFAEAPVMARQRTPWMTIQVGAAAFPRYAADPKTIARAEALLGDVDLDPALRRVLVDATDELQRSLAARRLEERL